MNISLLRAIGPRVARHEGGATALLFGLLLLPLLGAIGLAIDFGNVMTMRTKAQMAADAAALQASGVARDLIRSGNGTDAASNAAIADAKARGTALFDAHAKQAGLKAYTIDVTVVRSGQKISSTAQFKVNSVNFISTVFGFKAFAAGGNAVASASLPTYADVYLALDTSQSMGIASTTAGMDKLYNAKSNMKNSAGVVTQFNMPIKCVFGCHVAESVSQSPYNDKKLTWTESFSDVAKRYGVELRIDVLRNSTKAMISTAQTDAGTASIYRLALYSMGMSTDNKSARLIELAPISDNFTSLMAKANLIDLNKGSGDSESYIQENLKTFSDTVPKSGDGHDQINAKRYAIIVTDGIQDTQSKTSNATCTLPKGGSNRCIGTVGLVSNGASAACKALKDNGVTVGIIYTTYAKISPIDTVKPQENWYATQVMKSLGENGDLAEPNGNKSALENCATSQKWFKQASDSDGIAAAMAEMFSQTSSAPSLTN